MSSIRVADLHFICSWNTIIYVSLQRINNSTSCCRKYIDCCCEFKKLFSVDCSSNLREAQMRRGEKTGWFSVHITTRCRFWYLEDLSPPWSRCHLRAALARNKFSPLYEVNDPALCFFTCLINIWVGLKCSFVYFTLSVSETTLNRI